MADLVDDINGFISQYSAARRGQQLASDALPTMYPTYYAPSLMFSDRDTNSPPAQSINMSIASSSTYMSSCFDRPTPQTSSVYTEPPSVAFPQSQPYVAPSPLVCEFIGFGECDEVFSDEARWITHIAKDHLHYRFPSVCICWFCDRKFKASSQADTEACYRKRMCHIAKHFRNGLSGMQMRPDFFLLDHLYKYGLVDGDMYHKAQAYHEAPQIPNLYPAGWRPEYHNQRPVLVETSRPRHGRLSTRDRAPQIYHS
ncbi:hypothetical protein F53441_5620 [Fusarium austroafricanum]|uniref:Uncharacterized protein n=1 Tax=Fusarium austroafricanum TaxID=2364996 RepID=A0A8H4KKJ9_9HYPO|nr:hypothetical protein F53441_5620 [Fusarium austroafricanum]